MKIYFLAHLNVFSFLIALIALAVSMYSVYYTRSLNRRRLDVSECTIDYSEDYPLIDLCIENVSPLNITVKSVKLSDVEGNPIIPIDFTPNPEEIRVTLEADSFPENYNLMPHKTEHSSYFIAQPVSDIVVTITCKERIHRFRKQQRFELHISDITY